MPDYGDVQEYRYIGFIRTPSFKKAIGLFRTDDIVALELSRNVQRTTSRVVFPRPPLESYIVRDRKTLDCYCVDWNGRQRSASLNLARLDQLIAGANLGDFLIERIEWKFKNPNIITWLNEELKPKNPIGDEYLYVTFQNNYAEELKKLVYLKELNQREISEFGFKLSVLDLVDLHTARVEKYSEKENIPLGDKAIIKAVLRSLDEAGWPVEQRRLELEHGIVAVPKPYAMRQYRLGDEHMWELFAQEEVE